MKAATSMLMMFMVCAFLAGGCASTKPEACTKAIELRNQARVAPADQKGILEAKAAGLEEACSREREGMWKNMQDQKKRESEYTR